jgi:hypothetical protein
MTGWWWILPVICFWSFIANVWLVNFACHLFLKFYCKRMTGEFCLSSVFEVLLGGTPHLVHLFVQPKGSTRRIPLNLYTLLQPFLLLNKRATVYFYHRTSVSSHLRPPPRASNQSYGSPLDDSPITPLPRGVPSDRRPLELQALGCYSFTQCHPVLSVEVRRWLRYRAWSSQVQLGPFYFPLSPLKKVRYL